MPWERVQGEGERDDRRSDIFSGSKAHFAVVDGKNPEDWSCPVYKMAMDAKGHSKGF